LADFQQRLQIQWKNADGDSFPVDAGSARP